MGVYLHRRHLLQQVVFFYVLILSDNLPTYKGKFVFFIELLKIPLPLSIRICRPHCPLQSLYATSDGLFIV